MFKFVITLIVTSFIVTVYATVTVYKKSQLKHLNAARRALAQLDGTIDALPMVFILGSQESAEDTLYSPDDITEVAVDGDRKMVGGTKFSLTLWGSKLETQMFFCPVQHPESSQKTWLAPRNFGTSERLKCAQEPTPEVIQDQNDKSRKCGFAKAGIHHMVGFSISPPESPYHYKTSFSPLYGFCYVEGIKKILFTSHLIAFPKLLDTNALLREQELSIPYHRDETYPTADYDELYWEPHNIFVVSRKSNYVVQNLVPNEDMPFGIWKKAINQSFNMELLHKDLIDVWKRINENVRNAAIEEANKDNPVTFYIRTGVIQNNVDVPLYDTQQIYNRWFKMVLAMSKENLATAGVVFIMNNFISSQSDFLGDELVNLNNEMEAFCSNIHCKQSLITLAVARGGWVKCCTVTPEIAKLLDYYEGFPEFLHISGLTVR